jgi:hypothetical protein
MRGERMPNRVRGGRLGDACPMDGLFHGPLEDRFVQVMPPALSRAPIAVCQRPPILSHSGSAIVSQ